MFEHHSFPLNPVEFFSLSCDCYHLPEDRRGFLLSDEIIGSDTSSQARSFGVSDISTLSLNEYILPSTHDLTGEEAFAKLAIAWSEEGLRLLIQVNQTATQSSYPNIENGDSVELFFDTRDLKSSGFNTRFCHHFFFLPHAVEGVSKGEKTHFRTEDQHPVCDPESLKCEIQLKTKRYQMKIFIPRQSLHGYDPRQFKRLGFTYRINRQGGEPQHFSVVSQDYHIDQQPSLWGSLILRT